MSPARLASQPLPPWVGIGMSFVTGLTAIGRGQDYLSGSSNDVLAGLQYVGFAVWGWTLVLAGVTVVVSQFVRMFIGYIWPLMLMHLCLLFVYAGLSVAFMQGEPWSDVGRRALVNCAGAGFFHVARVFVLNREKNLARLLSVESG